MFIFLIVASGCKNQGKTICINTRAPIEEQFNEPNSFYLIKETIDLGGEMVIIPTNSKLKFEKKGSLLNGTIFGDETQITGCPRFDSVRLKGHFVNKDYYASWCSPQSISDFIEDVMNISGETAVIVDCDITLNNQKRSVNHLTLKGENTTILNSDRYTVTYGGTEISNLKFRWNQAPLVEPKDNYFAVVIYSNLLLKDTTIVTRIENVDADGGGGCSYFMKQFKGSVEPKLRTENTVYNCSFSHFTRGAIITCGGSGSVVNCQFRDIGYDKTESLLGVTALRLGYNNKTQKGLAIGYKVKDCVFSNIVAPYNSQNDGRELHGLLAYGDSIEIRDNQFLTLSTSFEKATDTGMDSEMLYIKGSHNVIENNVFKDGAGSLSDGVVTLKVGTTEGNIVRNNRFFLNSTRGKFIYLGGQNHIIEGNNFVSTFSVPSEKTKYSIYLGYQEENEGRESVVINDNTFSFMEEVNYTAIYANRWGNLTLTNNEFNNPTKLLRCNKRQGVVTINNNIIRVDKIKEQFEDNFIGIYGSELYPAEINNNEFFVTNSKIGTFILGSNYSFNGNKIVLNKTSLEALLRGKNTHMEVVDNTISIDKKTKICQEAIVGEKASSKIVVKDNLITDRCIREFLK
jgi:hypothetical protein